MPDLATLIPLGLLVMAIGGVAGVLAGLLGVGGGIVLVPAFFYAFSVLGYGGEHLMQVCLGTSLATIVVTSVRSVIGHHRKGAVEWDVLKAWAPGIALGALLGFWAASALRSEFLQAIFGALGIVIGLYMVLGRSHWRLGESLPTGAARAAYSGGVGFLSVLMGIGGGSFGVPLMTLYGVPIHRAVATAAGFGLIIAVPSVAGFLLLDLPVGAAPPLTIGAVNLVVFALVITMTLITTPLGVRLAHALEPGPLKRAFGIFLTVIAANMARQALFG